MKLNNLVLLPLLVACASKAPPQTTPSSALPPVPAEPPQEVIANPLPAVAQAPDPAPPPPKMFAAQVDLVPVKAQKQLKPIVVQFQQQEGKSAVATADPGIEGLRPGTYHFVVHEAAECGPNGTKAGKIWEPAAAMPITISVAKDAPAKLDGTDVGFSLEGDQSIVGKTLVLHDDAKGKPGKVIACGAVSKVEIPDQPSTSTQTPPTP
jgi:Cu/Zn superoxide dismutase